MRLLDARRKVLEDFEGEIPPYAILSHTWEEEEVLFGHLQYSDIDHANYSHLKGWYKIEKSCEQALRDGLDYVWIDAACIDKSSSAELSEAINSMFKWYRNSAICYAFLCDVPTVKFEASRWFTRGWTLQEMIAPVELKFYDGAWNCQGSKSELVDQLYQITGVDEAVLLGRNLRFTSVARRMSWAAKRQTKRIEDIAYCLLGLFDISMPMLYGEGPKAFIRLQEEIVKNFAESADIVPCVGRRLEPTVVTSRGVRITTVLAKNPDDDSTLLAALNCRSLEFDMEHLKRVAIAVQKCGHYTHSDIISAYIRVKPSELSSMLSKSEERVSLYVLKDNHIDFAESYVFWVRTMPLWAPDRPYKLHLAHPRQQWDNKNSLFKIDRLTDTGFTQLALVFREDCPSGEPAAHFLVFLGFTIAHQANGLKPKTRANIKVWCHTQFHRALDLDS